ncbi:hypothetical protein [Neptunomonas sp.]|uniref:hypothetical protein n=1 Tax=Neptunomonas sp. TaxID=1971898 RepID=UPI0035681240
MSLASNNLVVAGGINHRCLAAKRVIRWPHTSIQWRNASSHINKTRHDAQWIVASLSRIAEH